MGQKDKETPKPPARPASSSGPTSGHDIPSSRPLGHAPSASEAVDVLERFWKSEMLKPGGPAAAARLDALVSGGTPSVKRRTYAEYRAIVIDRIGPREPNPAIIFGSIRSLQRDGECWDVHYDGMLGGGLGACVDAADGRVALIWETPGG